MNGKPVRQGAVRRILARFSRGSAADADLGPGDPDLVVVAESFDQAAASSSVLEASRWVPTEQAVLAHFLAMPPDRVDEAVSVAEQDGYERVEGSSSDPGARAGEGSVLLVLARAQLVDALHCSQERARMAGLGARHDGEVLGWQVLQRP
ncbi:hypothetical protein KIK15_00745 [Williamsia sp. CHRR-6]|nr:hypothetical protein [Williamsia sp. CHRR-6]